MIVAYKMTHKKHINYACYSCYQGWFKSSNV
nr:MAG TPA: hypothetical protein [Caudoviricetes sp.]